MVNYEKIFEPYYEGGWEAYPLETTLITAGALNDYDAALMHIEDYLDTQVDPNDNLAETYSDEDTYEAGDYRIYNGVLYKCLEDIDEAEEFDPTKWESCLVTDEMATSGGTTVIANPVGTPTDDLETIQIGNTIYDIPGGGGGNANIWTGTQAELEEVFDELEEGTQINITDDEQEVVEGGTIYSEDEQVIGLWIDNKPLYQRTYTWTGEIIPNGYTVLDANLLSNVIDNLTLVNAEYKASSTSGGTILSNVYTNSIGGKTVEVSTNDTIGLYIENLTTTYIRQAKVTIQYTKVSDAPLDVVVGKSTMYIASSDCYSTEEKEVGCWHNGKPLYQKSYIFTSGWSLENWSALANLASLNIDDFVSSNAKITRTGDIQLTFNGSLYPESSNATNYKVSVRYNSGNLEVLVVTYDNITQIVVTIQYTKTTDTAGSGQYTPASGKAVHYSTDEQVIGTWEGKPLYRKMVKIASFTSANALITNSIYYGQFRLSDYIDNVDMAMLDLNHSYLGTISTYTRTILNGQYEADTGDFTLFTIYSRQNVPLTLVIEYTKTTD